ncbi:hypothetical protein [Mycobacteroides abscessus]|uniref:hypothetical protein n=1 Tax=Mycobacteroides abscessus TaxID=36809 RepID=UPI001F177D8C|nr:hypothetical protein [Mycobacteroides abscessus]
MEGVVLACRLGAGIADGDLPEQAPWQLREFWCRTSGGLLLVDEQLGISGLTLHDPAEAKQRTQDRAEHGYELSESDCVLGEFVGDTDILIVDAYDAVAISTGSYPRADWYTFESLSDVLSRFLQAQAEKYWESTAR